MTAPENPATWQTSIAAEPGSRLDQLAEMYAHARPAADAAKARLEEITDAIKLALTEAAPGATRVDLNAPALEAPLRLAARTSWRLDTTRLKAEQPEVYVGYARQSTHWELRALPIRGAS